MTQDDIDHLSEKFKQGVVIKDRRWYFKIYPACFVGNEAVQWFIKEGKCKTKEEAVLLGQKLMDEGIFCHVVEDHQFENAKLFYKFNNPDGIQLQKKERQTFSKSSWLEKKGLTNSWSPFWVELKGNILKYFTSPRGVVSGSFNILGCKIENSPLSSRAFELISQGRSIVLRAENEQSKNSWISVICRAKDRTLHERDKLLREWERAGECTSCIAALASEQAIQEEEQEEKDTTQDPSIIKNEEKEDKKSETLKELFSLSVTDVEEKVLTLRDALKKDIVVLSLLRHFG